MVAKHKTFVRRHGNIIVPETTTKLLTSPSKMPGRSFSIPALGVKDARLGGSFVTCPSAVTHVNSVDEETRSLFAQIIDLLVLICAGCYARSGRYNTHVVQNAQLERLVWTERMLRDNVDEWVNYMVGAIILSTKKIKYFRIHDSGDMYSPEYANAWLRVIRRVYDIDPSVRFWIPTRGWYINKKWSMEKKERATVILNIMKEMNAVGNTTVRPSALPANIPAPTVNGLSAGTGVSTRGEYTCPSSLQNNECGKCRTCWDNPDVPVIYKGHAKIKSERKMIRQLTVIQ